MGVGAYCGAFDGWTDRAATGFDRPQAGAKPLVAVHVRPGQGRDAVVPVDALGWNSIALGTATTAAACVFADGDAAGGSRQQRSGRVGGAPGANLRSRSGGSTARDDEAVVGH